jgi:hypothetical protein
VLEVVAERVQVLVGCEVLLPARPVGDRVDDASNQLTNAALALGRSNLAAEILRNDNVGGLLRPALRNLDVALLEDELAALVRDDRGAQIPLDLVERVDIRVGEEPRKCQPCDRRRFLRTRLARLDARPVGVDAAVEGRTSMALDALTGSGGVPDTRSGGRALASRP